MEDIYCFGGNPLDRVSDRRKDAAWVATLLDDPNTRILPLRDLKPLVRGGVCGEGPPGLDWQQVGAWRPLIDNGAPFVLLGLAEGQARFALDASGVDAAPDWNTEAIDIRALAPSIDGGDAAILAEARSVLDWHARHRFCAQCGSPSQLTAAGWNRDCANCGAHHFPRTDPVVIMLAVRGDHCLLGRNRRRAGSRFSCLAGFMEPGETLEEAVRREVLEESGVRIGRVHYLASQPWPFPSTLMMGFLAEAVSEAIAVDEEELAEARWFHRDEVCEMVRRAAADEPGSPSLPPPLAIAHHICRRWAFGLDAI